MNQMAGERTPGEGMQSARVGLLHERRVRRERNRTNARGLRHPVPPGRAANPQEVEATQSEVEPA